MTMMNALFGLACTEIVLETSSKGLHSMYEGYTYRNPSLTRHTEDLKSQARILCQSFRREFQKIPAK